MSENKKLIVRLRGGLGNQLFSFATGLSIAESNGYDLVLDTESGFKYDTLYRRKFALGTFDIKARHATRSERLVPFDRVRRKLKKYVSGKKALADKDYIIEDNQEFDASLKNVVLKKPVVYLDGLWQNLLYFSGYEDLVRSHLTFNISPNDQNRNFADWVKCKEVAVIHLRFFSSHYSSNKEEDASTAYYTTAIQYLLDNTNVKSFAIFSDDVAAANTLLSELGVDFKLVDWNQQSGEEIYDLWLMSQGRHFILANSTFSWWAAWLSEKHSDQCVLYPLPDEVKNTTNWAWAFPGQMPKEWIPIKV
jgi:hypothetical protein